MRPVCRRIPLLLALALALALPATSAAVAPEKLYYAIEVDGTLCGYSMLTSSAIEQDGKEWLHVDQELFLMLSALGSRFNTTIDAEFLIDPETGAYVHHESHADQGERAFDWSVDVEGSTLTYRSTLGDVERTIELEPDVVLENPLSPAHLVRDFVDGTETEKRYRLFDVREGNIHEIEVTRVRDEQLELKHGNYDTVVLDQLDLTNGLEMRLWIDRASRRTARLTVLGRDIYLTDASVPKRIKVATLDTTIISPTNVRINDVQAIGSMKVRAILEPIGLRVTPEALNVPGQRFEGTVEGNRIDGIFEIEHARYDGANAPPFPPSFGDDPELAPYLEPDRFIESDDEMLVAKARELTEGAADSWQAATRLARWVAENIQYEIPGGGTARKSYEMRAGECGAHSILHASFARAVGIPARVVWGGMYVPDRGGAFGQHAWSEIYMGEAGWIPVDTTAMEIDFVDSGHVRIGELDSLSIAFNAVEMEILDHTLLGGGTKTDDARFAEYLGEYTHVGGTTMRVVVENGMLGVDIPQRTVLLLEEPDEQDRWWAQLAKTVYCTFSRTDNGSVDTLEIHERVRMRRADTEIEPADEVPEALRPLIGDYRFAQLQATFEVRFRDGSLVLHDPLAKRTVAWHAREEDDWFVNDLDGSALLFEKADDGAVVALLYDSANRFVR